MELSETATSFQRSVADLAEKYKAPAGLIYGWWKEYASACRFSDQSPVLSEFEQWYKGKLVNRNKTL